MSAVLLHIVQVTVRVYIVEHIRERFLNKEIIRILSYFKGNKCLWYLTTYEEVIQ